VRLCLSVCRALGRGFGLPCGSGRGALSAGGFPFCGFRFPVLGLVGLGCSSPSLFFVGFVWLLDLWAWLGVYLRAVRSLRDCSWPG
jgi:hypothetical protein